MHKKLAADLISIAHSILQLKNKDDVFTLKNKAYEVYEKLAVLAYVEEYINNTPNAEETKEELIEKIEAVEKSILEEREHHEDSAVDEVIEKLEIKDEVEVETDEGELEEEIELTEEVSDVVEIIDKEIPVEEALLAEENEEIIDEHNEVEIFNKQMTLEEELSDTISLDVAADLFEKAPERHATVNDRIQQHLQIGLNDRIAFVKNLFEGNQEDFNRIISQINTLKSLKEVKKFLNKQVKPDYNWADKEEYELRFMELVERKFE